MRKYYLDNLRSLVILMLVPFHICMIYNGFESFYVHAGYVRPLSDFVLLTSVWFMPLLFVLAGISARYALKIRTGKQYLLERVTKLLVPLAAGILLLVPAQTYYAERFHNGYTGGYFAQYLLFFTKPTDLTGYHGGFTPGHLWFILFLFGISLFTFPLLLWYNRKGKTYVKDQTLTLPVLLALFVIAYVCSAVLDFGGKSVGQACALFLLGYFVLSRDAVIDRLARHRFLLLGLAAALLCVLYVSWHAGIVVMGYSITALFQSLIRHLILWVCVLAALGLARRYLNGQGRVWRYLARSSFGFYLFHQTWVIAAGYYALRLTGAVAAQVLILLFAAYPLSFASYELARRIGVLRVLFGIKAIKKN